ncbi:MAG: hypothetical protein DRN01_04420 [Thermoplasmata archaeon]|nr:MAG: hypothetical protein DRN01_04420 [Thermoplasmata archaeon]
MSVVTLLTDFGDEDAYVAEMKGVILGIVEDMRIVDISHKVTPYSIDEGAFLLLTVVPYFPKGTVHVAVVDPGVGTSRRGIVVETETCTFVGPDNGLLIPAAKRCGVFRVFEITNTGYMLPSKTHTFHGRDVFAPVAAYIAKGVDVEEIGRRIEDYVDFDFNFVVKNEKIISKVLHVDRFGNVVIGVNDDFVVKRFRYGEKIRFLVKGREYVAPFLKSYGFVEKNELLLTVGGTGFLEVSVNQGSAAEKLDVEVGEVFTLFL